MRAILIISLFLLFIKPVFSQEPYWVNGEHSWDTIDFETPYLFLELDTSSQNIWQIGLPNKILFDSAFSPPKAIITDTINFYPINNYSFFDLKIGSFNYGEHYNYDEYFFGNTLIEFTHKIDTDSLKDGGFLTISYDYGKTWMNIIEDTMPNYWGIWGPEINNENLYYNSDTLFNGEKGISGHSNKWIKTWFGWWSPGVKKSISEEFTDTMILRFNFISDDIETYKEGWIIDNIRLYSKYTTGIPHMNLTKSINIYPNPTYSDIIIDLDKEYKKIAMSIIDITGRTIECSQFLERKTISLKTSDLLPGVYIIKILLNGEIKIYKKIIVN